MSDPTNNIDACGERDPLFDNAVEITIELGYASLSVLQSRLAIGYARASRLIDEMGRAGIIGEREGVVSPKVVVTMEEWERMRKVVVTMEEWARIRQQREQGGGA